MSKRKVLAGAAVIGAVAVAVVLLVLVGKRDEEGREVPAAAEWFLTYLSNSYSSLGRLYMEDGFLYFQDVSAEEGRIICGDPVCAHRREDCSAYFGGFITEGIMEKDRLLLFTDYGYDRLGELYLYETALDGSRRRLLAKLSDNVQYVQGASVTDDYIAIAYYNSYDENGEQTDEPTAGILLYDRTSGKSRDIVQITMWNARLIYPKIIGNRLYYEYMGFNIDREDAIAHAEDQDYYQEHMVLRLAACSMDGKTEDIAEIDDFNPLMLYNDCFLYTADGQLYGYNVETKESEVLGEAMRVVPGDGKEGIYLTDYDSQRQRTTLYRYDGTVQYVGEYTNEWNISAVFEGVIYALHYDGEINSGIMKAVTLAEVID